MCIESEGGTGTSGWNWCVFHCWQCPISPEPSTMSSLVIHVGPLRGGHWHCLWASEAGTVLSPVEISVLSGTLLATFLYRTHSISYMRAEEAGYEGRLGTWLLISCWSFSHSDSSSQPLRCRLKAKLCFSFWWNFVSLAPVYFERVAKDISYRWKIQGREQKAPIL